MDELETARAIAAGQLTSPQRIDTLALYAMRVSGTGVSYRRGLDEFVWRDPNLYLSQDMIDRCAGLPVIMEHPESNTLNSDEFAGRVVGGVMFGYVKDDELWCVARIYDDDAIAMMEKDQLSTSPAVVFKDPSVNVKQTIEGKTILIEGKPSLLDHLAICERGVWDKGGPATGIDVVRKDSVMTEDEKMADKARKDAEEKAKADAVKADAEAGQKIDKILTHLDSLGKRMDAWDEKEKTKADAAKAKADAEEDEKKEEKEKADKAKKDAAAKKDGEDEDEEKEEKGDPKKLAADKSKKDWDNDGDEDDKAKKDKAKKDAEDEKEEKEKVDAARKDSDDTKKKIADLESIVSSMRRSIPKQLTDADYTAMAHVQADAERVFSAHSKNAPRPMDGETLIAYRRRLAGDLKHHSQDWKDVDLGVIAVEPKAFEIAEKRIYADAMEAAMHPMDAGDDLREVRRRDPETGHMIKEYYGSPMAWMRQFTGGGGSRAKFNLGNRDNAR